MPPDEGPPSVDELTRVGLYDPDVDAGTGRLELLLWLHEQGLTVVDMVDAMERRALGAVVGDRHLVPGERMTRAEAIASSGLDPGRFDALVTAFGFVPVHGSPEGEIGFIGSEVRALSRFAAFSTLFSDSESLALVRVISAAISRIAEASVSLFLNDVESRAVQSGASELELAHNVAEAVTLIDGLTDELDPILRRQILQAIERSRATTIDEGERFLYRYAVGFVDLVGFTARSATMAGPQLGEFLRDFEGRAHDLARDAGARIVKFIGDEVMFVATDAAAACRAGAALMTVTAEESIVPRGGLAYGDVLPRGGDYYGSVVNLAARLVDEAVPGEVLVTAALAEAAEGCRFEAAGRRMVKGFDDPVVVRTLIGA